MQDPSAARCPYRISQDGLGLLLPHLTRQLLRPTAAEMLRLLKERLVALPFSQRLKPKQARPLLFLHNWQSAGGLGDR